MKKGILVLLAVMTGAVAQAQTESKLSGEEIDVGYNYQTDTSIRGEEFLLAYPLYKYTIDSAANIMVLALRQGDKKMEKYKNRGLLVAIDVSDNTVLWDRPLDYTKQSVRFFDGMTAVSTGGKKHVSLLLDNSTGAEIARTAEYPFFADKAGGVVLTRNVETAKRGMGIQPIGYMTRLKAYSIASGEVLWEELMSGLGVDGPDLLDDSTVVSYADGLYMSDLRKGPLWNHRAETTDKDHRSAAVDNGLKSKGRYTKYRPFLEGRRYVNVKGVNSNAIDNGDSVVWASRRNISCLNRKGEVLWQTPLPKDSVSVSTLVRDDSTVYITNMGYAVNAYYPIYYGVPFFAAFDLETGRCKYTIALDDIIMSKTFAVETETVHILTPDALRSYSYATGELLRSKEFHLDDSHKGSISFSRPDLLTYDSDSMSMRYFEQMFSSRDIGVYYHESNLAILDGETLEEVAGIPFEKIYVPYAEADNYVFIANNNGTKIIDIDQKVVASFNGEKGVANIIGRRLYLIGLKGFVSVDLDQVLPPDFDLKAIPGKGIEVDETII